MHKLEQKGSTQIESLNVVSEYFKCNQKEVLQRKYALSAI